MHCTYSTRKYIVQYSTVRSVEYSTTVYTRALWHEPRFHHVITPLMQQLYSQIYYSLCQNVENSLEMPFVSYIDPFLY